MVTKATRRPNTDALASVEYSDDVVDFMLRCVLAIEPRISQEVTEAVERHVRHFFGETAESRRRVIAQRNAAIVRDYLAGERIGLLSRRYGLSERRILQIVKE